MSTTPAHFTARPRRRQMTLTPEVQNEVARLFSAYLLNDRLQIENSLKQLAFWDDLQMLADTDGDRFRNGSAR